MGKGKSELLRKIYNACTVYLFSESYYLSFKVFQASRLEQKLSVLTINEYIKEQEAEDVEKREG